MTKATIDNFLVGDRVCYLANDKPLFSFKGTVIGISAAINGVTVRWRDGGYAFTYSPDDLALLLSEDQN